MWLLGMNESEKDLVRKIIKSVRSKVEGKTI